MNIPKDFAIFLNFLEGENLLKKLLIVLICALYPIHIFMDFTGSYNWSDYIKFTVIACAFIISICGDIILVKAALLFTLMCDFLLLFTSHRFFAVSLFCVVQLIYSYIFSSKKDSSAKYCYLILAVLPFIYYFTFKGPLVCVFYAFVLLCNLLSSIKIRKPRLILAFSLFALCDLCVAIYNITSNDFFHPFIWIFYTPSQLLLSLSCAKEWKPDKI